MWEQEVVGHWAAQQEKELKLLSRADGSKLFSNLTRGNHYLVQAEGYLNNSGSGQASEMALIWNRTLPGGSVSIGIFLPQNISHISIFITFLEIFVMKVVNIIPLLFEFFKKKKFHYNENREYWYQKAENLFS